METPHIPLILFNYFGVSVGTKLLRFHLLVYIFLALLILLPQVFMRSSLLTAEIMYVKLDEGKNVH